MQNATEIRCVDKGFDTLMAADPDGRWMDKINLDMLDIISLHNCVLAQIHGSYASGLQALCPMFQHDWAVAHPGEDAGAAALVWTGQRGFSFFRDGADFVTNSGLTRAWKDKITKALSLRRIPA